LSLDQTLDWRKADLPLPRQILTHGGQATSIEEWDQAVLDWVRHQDCASAQVLHDLSLGLSRLQADLSWRAFYKIAAAFFELLDHRGASKSTSEKRLVLQILLQCRGLFAGVAGPDQNLGLGLLRHCERLAPNPTGLPLWGALQRSWSVMAISEIENLSKADLHSRELESLLAIWTEAPMFEAAIEAASLAWSLALYTEAVGLNELSVFSTQLALGLQWGGRSASPEQTKVLAAAGQHLRMLLHQHAAGLDPKPHPDLLVSLQDLVRTTA